MGLLRTMQYGAQQVRADMGGTPAPWDDFWYRPIGTRSATGIRVTPESAKQVSAVLACVNKISKTQAMLPFKMYKNLSDGGKATATRDPLYNILYSQPNDQQDAYEWRQMAQGHIELRGNSYNEIKPSDRSAIGQLVPMHPDRVKPEQLMNGRVRYRYDDPMTNDIRYLPQEMVFHIRNSMDHGIVGQSTISMAIDTIGLALAAQDNYARFLKNDSRNQLVLTGASFKTKQDKIAFRNDWQEQNTGENRYKIGVLPIGMDLKTIGVNAADAELLDSRKFSRIEICSIFDVPPHLIGETEKTATYASVEQFNIMFATYCILPRLIMWEQAVQRQLVLGRSTFPKFSMGALLRGDSAARAAFYKTMIQLGVLSQNDVRIMEDMNPIEDGDNYWRPLNWARLGDVHTSVKSTGGDDQTASPTESAAQIDERFYALLIDAAGRCARKESGAVARMIEKDATHEEVDDFYREHAGFVAKVLKIPAAKAQHYCERRAAEYKSLPDNKATIEASVRELTALALGGIQ